MAAAVVLTDAAADLSALEVDQAEDLDTKITMRLRPEPVIAWLLALEARVA